MPLRIGNREFRPSWVATLLTLALLPLLIKLGYWQLQRAEDKRALMMQAEVGKHSTLVLNSNNVSQLQHYQHLQVQGHFDSDHQVLLDNMPSKDGHPGYRVLTPLKLDDGAIILIDRGWLPWGAQRAQLPQITVDETSRTLTGLLDDLPRPGVRAGDAGVKQGVWPQVLNYPRYAELQPLYGSSLQQRIVLMDATVPDGFERVWQINLGFGPERHVAYAVQWFALALALLIIYLVVNLKPVTEAQPN